MKRKLLLTAMALGTIIPVFGQKRGETPPHPSDSVKCKKQPDDKNHIKTRVFTLDLAAPTRNALVDTECESPRLQIRTREPLAFQLINGNPYKYTYVINHNVINLFGNAGVSPIDSLGKLIIGNGTPGAKQEQDDPTTQGIAKAQEELKKLEDDLKVAKSNQSKDLTRATSWDKRIQELNDDISIKKAALRDLEANYVSKSIYSKNYVDTVKFNNFLNTARAGTARNPEGDIETINTAISLLKEKFNDLNIDLETYLGKVSAEDFLTASDFSAKRATFAASFSSMIRTNQEIGNEAAQFEETKKNYDETLKNIQPVSDKIKEKITEMLQLKLQNYMLPVDINGKNIDAVEITVERYARKGVNPTPDRYTYNIWVKGGVKIDVSGGIFLSTLMDKEYEIKGTGANQTILEKKRGKYDSGFGSTLNLSLRSADWVRPTLSFGALFTTNQKFQLLTGVGLILGKEERIILQGGLSMGRTSGISSAYKADGATTYDLGTAGTVSTTEKFSFGHFFGLTYNFGKVNKEKATK
ncbi:hypothetical protein BWD42_07795 [Sphingobacterium sp. CZ-UAM]|uniref:hypothetical protein n=1 Tax=Sphingobacterium sp. CZ-UAM TaxID=1933868 RepID=UPI0009853274|nr:hypothetical protein [Sphingobacterium sp. CZ-UAM]OOG19791.1 hypothetical protein BWD42_07795 [Sphingobacterium sp. CZ-UAM]